MRVSNWCLGLRVPQNSLKRLCRRLCMRTTVGVLKGGARNLEYSL